MDPNPVKVLLIDNSIILTNKDTSLGQQTRETISAANRRKKDMVRRERRKRQKRIEI